VSGPEEWCYVGALTPYERLRIALEVILLLVRHSEDEIARQEEHHSSDS
jgi:hypothetical protein